MVATTGFPYDLLPERWKVVGDDEENPVPVSQLEPVSFLKPGESYVRGEEMRRRAREMNANPGLRQGKILLDEQEKISKEWRPFYLPLPGTLLRSPIGGLYVPYLGWDGGGWGLPFRRLVRDWYAGDRLLRRK